MVKTNELLIWEYVACFVRHLVYTLHIANENESFIVLMSSYLTIDVECISIYIYNYTVVYHDCYVTSAMLERIVVTPYHYDFA